MYSRPGHNIQILPGFREQLLHGLPLREVLQAFYRRHAHRPRGTWRLRLQQGIPEQNTRERGQLQRAERARAVPNVSRGE